MTASSRSSRAAGAPIWRATRSSASAPRHCLIVGGHDYPVIGLNREAQQRLKVESELVIVPGATHLFEEPGTLDQVIAHASRWFLTHLAQTKRHSA